MERIAAQLDERLDELYREHPELFVAGRDRLAKDLRAAGEEDEGERVRKLRRPTVAAWLINRAALESPRELQEFADASRQLEEAQRRALEGEDQAGADMRSAAARERDATGAVVDVADRVARDAGRPASDRALELVGETLRASVAEPELRERILRGRLEREQSAATLGRPEAGPLPKRRARSAKQRQTGEARRKLKRLESKLAQAATREERLRERVEEATTALRDEKASLAASKRETAALKRQRKAAEQRASG